MEVLLLENRGFTSPASTGATAKRRAGGGQRDLPLAEASGDSQAAAKVVTARQRSAARAARKRRQPWSASW
jgi:hypothetical protein